MVLAVLVFIRHAVWQRALTRDTAGSCARIQRPRGPIPRETRKTNQNSLVHTIEGTSVKFMTLQHKVHSRDQDGVNPGSGADAPLQGRDVTHLDRAITQRDGAAARQRFQVAVQALARDPHHVCDIRLR